MPALVVSTGLSVARVGEGTTVRLKVAAVGRPAPEPLGKGWGIKAPTVRTRYTDEQKALLLECFNNPQRPNEANAHTLFKLRFVDRDGKFARSLVMSAAKIKAWYGSEKQRRAKAATVRWVAAEAQDEEDADAAAALGAVGGEADAPQGGDGECGSRGGRGGRSGRGGCGAAGRWRAAGSRGQGRRLVGRRRQRVCRRCARRCVALVTRRRPRPPRAPQLCGRRSSWRGPTLGRRRRRLPARVRGEESSDDGADESDEGDEALQGGDVYAVQARPLR